MRAMQRTGSQPEGPLATDPTEVDPDAEGDDAATRQPRFAVLAGNPRSGSHALALELERRGAIAVPTEPRFATAFARWRFLAGDLRHRRHRQRLLRCIFAFLWLWEGRNRSREELRQALPHSMLALAPQAEGIAGHVRGYGGVVHALHAAFARQKNAYMGLDKVTFLRDEPLEALKGALPGLKIVHVVRDGRDVAMSWRRVWFGVGGLDEAALRWSRRTQALRDWQTAAASDYLEVRYEDLVADPDATCARVFAFLGLASAQERTAADPACPEASGSASYKGVTLASRAGHERLAQPLNADSIARWAREMSAHERSRFESLAGDSLEAFGYEPIDALRTSRFRALLTRTRVALGSLTRATFWKQCAVAWLPAVLLLSDRLGLPLARRLNERAIRFAHTGGE